MNKLISGLGVRGVVRAGFRCLDSHAFSVAVMGAVASAALITGCAVTNPPLMFGDITTFGLRIGNDTATAGGSVSLGYKAQSVAIVPVSALDANGKPGLLKGRGRGQADAMSVFASFVSASPASGADAGSTVQLGQVFSTGLAAQSLTMGYVCRENADPSCAATASAKAMQSAAAADSAAASALAAARAASGAASAMSAALGGRALSVASAPEPAPRVDATDRPYQKPLLFLRTDVVGIDIGGSVAQQGLQFVLGYSNRNLALIPVATVGAGQQIVRISGSGEGTGAEAALDSLSVLGQFKANSETKRLGFGLERYFSTGVAARNLGESLESAIAKVPLPSDGTAASRAAMPSTEPPVTAPLAAK